MSRKQYIIKKLTLDLIYEIIHDRLSSSLQLLSGFQPHAIFHDSLFSHVNECEEYSWNVMKCNTIIFLHHYSYIEKDTSDVPKIYLRTYVYLYLIGKMMNKFGLSLMKESQ